LVALVGSDTGSPCGASIAESALGLRRLRCDALALADAQAVWVYGAVRPVFTDEENGFVFLRVLIWRLND
jgi:hypothetical protein